MIDDGWVVDGGWCMGLGLMMMMIFDDDDD